MTSVEEEDDGFENGSLDGEDDEEDDNEEEEPKLKFDRIGNDLTKILSEDAVSCVAVHSKFLCVGSHLGRIYVLDQLGNNVTLQPRKSMEVEAHAALTDRVRNDEMSKPARSIEAHTLAVNQISIDSSGDYIASCSDDGKINIHSLCDGQNVLTLSLDRKIHAIAIDPQYSKGGMSRRFIVAGDDGVTLYERTLFSRLKPTPLLQVGPVTDINWNDRFVAWSYLADVRIYDMVDMVTISRVQFDNLKGEKGLNYHCNLYWKDPFTIIIGWADEVQICSVKRQLDAVKLEQGALSYYVQITNMFTTDFWICGMSSFGQYLIVLCLDKFDDLEEVCMTSANKPGQRPKLHIIEPNRVTHDLVYTHVLQTRGYQEYKTPDYHLQSLTDELLFFVITPKDIILAKSRDVDDHIQWLVEHRKFEQALECTSQNSKMVERHSVLQVGTAYLDNLMETKRFNEAGKLCLQILGKENWKKWEEQVMKFARLGQLRAIAPFLPRSENYHLEPYIYEMVLFDYLKNDQEAFLCLVRDWAPPPDLFNVTAIINAVIDHLLVCEPDNRFLLQALADLYSYQRKYGKALAMYLRLQDPQVFSLIQRYGLFEEIKENIEDLMALNTTEALLLFMKEKARIEPSLIVEKLHGSRFFLYKYLDCLFRVEGKEMRPEFHGLVVCLYADFGPDKLLQFLKSSDNYPMQEAMDICRTRKLYPEMIFLLGRMGNAREALRLITHELDDINQAVEFCKEHDDKDLWSDLIKFSMDKPDYINVLLCNIGTHVDPQILVRKIENGMEIPGLRDSLVKIMQDYSLQVALQEGCKNILATDCLVLFEKLVKTQLHGVFVDDDQECGSCHKSVIRKGILLADDIKVFYCKHVFHDSCLSTFDYQNCIICNLPQKGICLLEKL